MSPTRYRIVHRTSYHYAAPVALAHGVGHLTPRRTVAQTVASSAIEIDPPVDHRWEYLDAFGNPTTYWSIEHAHQSLDVVSHAEVEVWPAVVPATTPPWEAVPSMIRAEHGHDAMDALLCSVGSTLVGPSSELEAYARPSFPPGRPLFEAVADLTSRIHREFEFDPGFSDVTTPVAEVLCHRRGVCQDLAHVAVGCLRSMGLSARYVSGYLETEPLPGLPRLVGADASHAWVATFIPGWGWLDADPTNDATPPERYVTVAWGRDYADVAPIRGVVFGPPSEQTLSVSVDVARIGA